MLALASPTFSDSFIKNFRQKENKNGSPSYFYKDRTPYSADPKFSDKISNENVSVLIHANMPPVYLH